MRGSDLSWRRQRRRPERATIGVEARLVGVNALATFFLVMIRNLAEDTNLFVSGGVTPWLLLVWIPPGIRISPVGVAGRSSVVVPEVLVLTTKRLVGGLLLAESDSINGVFCLVFDREDFRGRFSFLSGV